MESFKTLRFVKRLQMIANMSHHPATTSVPLIAASQQAYEHANTPKSFSNEVHFFHT